MSREIWCIAEHRDGKLDADTWQLLGAARECGATAVAVVCGSRPDDIAGQLAAGADRVLALRGPALEQFTPDGYLEAIVPLLRERRPDAVLMLHSHYLGRDLGPRLAARLESGLISDCIDLEWEDGLVGSRLTYRRKLVARQKVSGDTPHFATCQRGAFSAVEPHDRAADIESLDVDVDPAAVRWEVLGFDVAESGPGDITEADVVVAGGRGIGSEEDFGKLSELARALGGSVAASRPVVDQGWAPRSLQVGSSGKTVRPRLYLALGISGAIQHVVGMRDSDVIVAVNKDPRAPIFEYADYGIVADLQEVLPLLTEKVRGLRGDRPGNIDTAR